jgi:hypothetical protein
MPDRDAVDIATITWFRPTLMLAFGSGLVHA